MKRLTSLVLALVLTVALFGCSSGASQASSAGAAASTAAQDSSGGASGAAEGETIVFKLAHQTPDDNFYDRLGKKFGELLAEKSGGRMTVEVFPNGQLGYDSELLQAMQFGTVDFAVVTCSPITNFVPNFGVFDLPYLIRDWDEMETVASSDVARELLANARRRACMDWACCQRVSGASPTASIPSTRRMI